MYHCYRIAASLAAYQVQSGPVLPLLKSLKLLLLLEVSQDLSLGPGTCSHPRGAVGTGSPRSLSNGMRLSWRIKHPQVSSLLP